MLSQDIKNLSLAELFGVLAIHTEELLDQLNRRNADGLMIYQKKADVQMLLTMIETRKIELTILPVSIL